MSNNPFTKAVRRSLCRLPADIGVDYEDLLTVLPKTFSIYRPLLLLPAHAFDAASWQLLLETLHTKNESDLFFNRIASDLKITHIALNAPISPHENIQRRPNITPIYGSFPPFVTEDPTGEDFAAALWVSTKQNGITQTWAPQYTMFSRGNITEKARVLSMPSVRSAVASGGCTAVDLYAGIGYFVFSYARAGCSHVLGFELNPWSVEGLRRGADANKWKCQVVHGADASATYMYLAGPQQQIILFQSTNEIAAAVVERNRALLPPVRHVNLGLLPTSEGSYSIAVRCLDPDLGGWLHIHENIAIDGIASKAEEVRTQIEQFVESLRGARNWHVELEHVERVKTYAPGVMHCVIDIHIYTWTS